MGLKEEQKRLQNNIQRVTAEAIEMEKLGLDKDLLDKHIEISNQLSTISDKLSPSLKREQKFEIEKGVANKYRATVIEHPRITKTIFFFLILSLSSMLLAFAAEGTNDLFANFKTHSNLFKASVFFSLSPVLLSMSLIALKTGVFMHRGLMAPTERNEKPILFWLQFIMWPGFSIGSIYIGWYWLNTYINS